MFFFRNSCKAQHANITKWTKDVNIFEKDFDFVFVNVAWQVLHTNLTNFYSVQRQFQQMTQTVMKQLCEMTALMSKKVQVGKDQEKAQSEKDSHSKHQGGKKPN